MKKVAFIVPRYYPIVGGTEVLAKNVLEYFAHNEQVCVEIITQPTELRKNLNYRHQIIEIPFADIISFNSTIRRNKYDLCVFFCDLHTPYLNFYDLSCKKNVCILNLDETTYENKTIWGLKGSEDNLKKFNLVITFTKNGIANKFLEENKINNIYIQNFSRDVLATEHKINFAQKLFNNSNKTILYNAAIEVRKNQFNVLNCISKNNILKSYNWIFIGTTPDIKYLDSCTNIIHNNSLNNCKFVKSTTSIELIDQVYQSCDYVALLSIAEGLPLVLIEAISAKKPWIATPVGGISGVLGNTNTGIILDSININDKQIQKALSEVDKINKNICRKTWEQNFKKEDVCETYNKILLEIMQ